MNDNTNNPYVPPESDVNNHLTERSGIPKVIGIISIILGSLGLLFGLFGLASMTIVSNTLDIIPQDLNLLGMSKTYLISTTILSVLVSGWAIWIGIKLLNYLDIGRRHFNFYTIFTIISSIFTFFYTKSMMDEMLANMEPNAANAASSMSSISSLSAFITPIILIIVALLLNQQNVKNCLSDKKR